VLSIVRTDRVDEDLIAIWLSIAGYNPIAADHVLDAIESRWRQLAYHPYSGIARDEIAPGIRHLVVGQYLTLYRIHDDAVQIVRVLHGRRDISSEAVG
jgi:toxin ParE1/3/4